jgi:hypothetical protein
MVRFCGLVRAAHLQRASIRTHLKERDSRSVLIDTPLNENITGQVVVLDIEHREHMYDNKPPHVGDQRIAEEAHGERWPLIQGRAASTDGDDDPGVWVVEALISIGLNTAARSLIARMALANAVSAAYGLATITLTGFGANVRVTVDAKMMMHHTIQTLSIDTTYTGCPFLVESIVEERQERGVEGVFYRTIQANTVMVAKGDSKY